MTRKRRYSPQRDAILQLVRSHGGHLSVDDIYQRLHPHHPKMSVATIYRNLKQLTDDKELSQAQGLDQSYYEPYAEPHHHFICTACHSIQNVTTPAVNVCTGCIDEKTPLKVESIVTTLYGLCESCHLE